jgi:hypothetical protein
MPVVEAYTRCMARSEDPHSGYGCTMLPGDLRRVSHPHDERPVERKGRLRRLAGKLAIARAAS